MRVARHGDLADRALNRAGSGLPPRDFGWTQELVYGTLRLRGRLDFLLDQVVRGPLDALEADVLDTLRLGAYQLLEMGSVPPYAAISQSVELVRYAGVGRAAGLVNGVLSNLQRRRDEILASAPPEGVERLVHWGSHPRWLVDRWIQRWGVEDAAALVEANNRRPELFLSVLGPEPSDAVSALSEGGIEAEPVDSMPGSLRLHPPAGARAALDRVPAVVQDPAAAMVARFAALEPGCTAVDLCAAPGGKAAVLAQQAGMVVAADLSAGRLSRVRDNVRRLGLEERVPLLVADGRNPPLRPVDAVLLDAPCTGTGTLRRHPDGRWRVSPADLAALAALQTELLDAAASLVAPGGLLVYSTCSLEPEENEHQVESFLARHPDFARETPEGFDPALVTAVGDLEVLPQRWGFDGSYAARLRRRA